LFQPEELTDPQLLVHERMVPITIKPKDFLSSRIAETENVEENHKR